jgi:hypothetical protein
LPLDHKNKFAAFLVNVFDATRDQRRPVTLRIKFGLVFGFWPKSPPPCTPLDFNLPTLQSQFILLQIGPLYANISRPACVHQNLAPTAWFLFYFYFWSIAPTFTFSTIHKLIFASVYIVLHPHMYVYYHYTILQLICDSIEFFYVPLLQGCTVLVFIVGVTHPGFIYLFSKNH